MEFTALSSACPIPIGRPPVDLHELDASLRYFPTLKHHFHMRNFQSTCELLEQSLQILRAGPVFSGKLSWAQQTTNTEWRSWFRFARRELINFKFWFKWAGHAPVCCYQLLFLILSAVSGVSSPRFNWSSLTAKHAIPVFPVRQMTPVNLLLLPPRKLNANKLMNLCNVTKDRSLSTL